MSFVDENRQGWQCPVCLRVWAPGVESCRVHERVPESADAAEERAAKSLVEHDVCPNCTRTYCRGALHVCCTSGFSVPVAETSGPPQNVAFRPPEPPPVTVPAGSMLYSRDGRVICQPADGDGFELRIGAVR